MGKEAVVSQIVVNGNSYIGEIVEKDGAVTVKNALQTMSVTVVETDIQNYFCADNEGTLQDINFGGGDISFTTSALTNDLKMHIQMCGMAMERAKAVSLARIINSNFRDFIAEGCSM